MSYGPSTPGPAISKETLERTDLHSLSWRCADEFIDVSVAVKKGKLITKSAVDLDNNNILDNKEWNNFLGILQRDTYTIDRKYFLKGDIHSIRKQVKSCNTCHAEGPLFTKALLTVSGTVSFKIPVEPTTFIPDLSSVEQFKKTLHGRKGVTCSDCHASPAKVTDQICINCHQDDPQRL